MKSLEFKSSKYGRYEDDSTIYDYGSSSASSFGSMIFGLGRIVILIILFFSVFRILRGGDAPSVTMTFETFLNAIKDAPTIDVSWANNLVIPDWLGDIWLIGGLLQFLANGFAFMAYLSSGLVNFVIYISWIFGYLFI